MIVDIIMFFVEKKYEKIDLSELALTNRFNWYRPWRSWALATAGKPWAGQSQEQPVALIPG